MSTLDVPYVSQLEGDAPAHGDCGPACLVMATGNKTTVNRMDDLCGLPSDYEVSTWRQLAKGTAAMGHTLIRIDNVALLDRITKRTPVICLVYYPFLPARYDANYNNWHYVVVVGIEGDNVIYHDPYWRKGLGAFIVCDRKMFDRAWSFTGEGAKTPRQAAYVDLTFPELVDTYELAKDIRWQLEQIKRELEAGTPVVAEARVSATITKAYKLEGVLKDA